MRLYVVLSEVRPVFPLSPFLPPIRLLCWRLTLIPFFFTPSTSDLGLRDEKKKIDHEDPHNPTHPPLFSTSQRITFQPGTLRPKDQSIPASVPASGHVLNISEQAQGQGIQEGTETSGLSGTGTGTGSGAGAGAGGPSTSFTGAIPRPRAGGKRGNKTRRVIEHPDELNTFDLDAMGPHQSGMSISHLHPLNIAITATAREKEKKKGKKLTHKSLSYLT